MHASRTFVPSPTLVPGGGGGRSGAASAEAEQPILDGCFRGGSLTTLICWCYGTRTARLPGAAACSNKVSLPPVPTRTLWPPPAVVRRYFQTRRVPERRVCDWSRQLAPFGQAAANRAYLKRRHANERASKTKLHSRPATVSTRNAAKKTPRLRRAAEKDSQRGVPSA